jgi:hypothetical protein
MIIKIVVIGLLSLWASILANKNIAVYHDGIRPIMGEYIDGRMKKAELIGISFAMSFGLIVGFGIPFSLTSQVILIHCILLGTDVIGIASPNFIVAGAGGALYGVGLTLGLGWVVNLFKSLPVNIMDGLMLIGDPIVISFSVLPALAVAYQFGSKKGLLTLVLSGLARIAINRVNPIVINGSNVSISPDGIALAVGMVMLMGFAISASNKQRSQNAEDTSTSDLAFFSEKAGRIKRNLIPLMIMGALISLGASLHFIGGSPMDVTFLSKGQISEAAMIAFIKVIGYLPLVVTTALVSGVWATGGICDWLFGLGYIVNPVVAPILGAGGMGAEVFGAKYLAKFLDKYPEIRKSGDHIRTAMTQVLEIALLVGGMIAANKMAPTFGFFVVAGLYIINIISGTRIVKMAVGPLGAILVGILVNIFAVVGLVSIK